MKYRIFIILQSIMTVSTCYGADLNIKVVDIDDQTMGDVVVFARPKLGLKQLHVNKRTLTIHQKDKKFAPYIAIIQKGQPLSFANKDDITHHIYSASKGNRFDFKLKAGADNKIDSKDFLGEVAMGCNIHDWMSGYVLVVDTPYYGKTDTNGSLSLVVKELGEYEISVWHPQLDLTKNRVVETYNIINQNTDVTIALPKKLSAIPLQVGQESFDFIEEY